MQNTTTITNPLSIPPLLKTTASRFNYAGAWEYLSLKGKLLGGEDFTLQEADAKVIQALICWALQDVPVAKRIGMDLHKGIYLNGPIGAGKTTLMRLLNYLLPAADHFQLRACRDVAFEFAEDGYETILRYSRKSFWPGQPVPRTICFDDLGLEPRVQYFGNTCQVMTEVLLSRYDLYRTHHMRTHITSNLTPQDIQDIYGNRVRSRMREMFNLVGFSKETDDKR